ncbi:MAG: GtrA family protein [Firmicutes bacterium]|nr:GtrA family protein [Bacillota bacterium]
MITKMQNSSVSRFIIVGIINTLVGTALMFGLYNLAGCSYWVSSALNYGLTSILSFFLNKYYTFKHRGDILGSAIRFAINIALCYLLAYGIAKPLTLYLVQGSQVLQENIAMCVGMVLFVVLNYSGQRLFAFRKK